MTETITSEKTEQQEDREPSIIYTKINLPRLYPTLVSRTRLHEKLEEGLQSKVISVIAPAGYGKTTAVVDWVNTRQLPVAWVSLDDYDNDGYRFWSYVLAAMDKLVPGIKEKVMPNLRFMNTPAIETFISFITDFLRDYKEEFLLILDNFQVIKAHVIHESLSFLTKYAPENMHIIFTSRARLPLPVHRLRAGGQLTEINIADLRFTNAEVGAFYRQRKIPLHDQDVKKLELFTEGWGAGLQLTSVSLSEEADLAETIDSFSGDDRDISTYLEEEVLAKLPEETRSFLECTSILDRLSGHLCDAVTGRDDSRDILARLFADCTFIISLDLKGNWYRYHHIFAQFLQGRLEKGAEHDLEDLHRRAAAWYEQEDMPEEAIQHYRMAGSVDKTVELISRVGSEMLSKGDTETLLEWLEDVPEESLVAMPELGLLFVWALALEYRETEAEKLLTKIEEQYRSLEGERADSLWGEGALARLRINCNDFPLMLSYLQKAQSFLPGGSCIVNRGLRYNLGLISPLRASMVSRPGCLAQLNETPPEQLEKLLEPFETTGFMAMFYVLKGEIAYETNCLEQANDLILKGVSEGERVGDGGSVFCGLMALARLRHAKGWDDGVKDILDQTEKKLRELKYQQLLPVLSAYRVRLWLEQGNMESVRSWLSGCGLSVYDKPSVPLEFQHLTLARVLIAAGKWDLAALLLQRLQDFALQESRLMTSIEVLNLQAVACHAQGMLEKSLILTGEALALSQTDGIYRIFLDDGPVLTTLIKNYSKWQRKGRNEEKVSVSPMYLANLVQMLKKEKASPPDHSISNVHEYLSGRRLLEQLTERETEVLRLLVGDLTNWEIASRLGVGINTVKVHNRNIYQKLDVKNRTQAVQRGKELHLI